MGACMPCTATYAPLVAACRFLNGGQSGRALCGYRDAQREEYAHGTWANALVNGVWTKGCHIRKLDNVIAVLGPQQEP